MRKKIGILTFHYSTNYGGVLQAFALQETIKKLNFDVEIINLRPQSYTQKCFDFRSLARTIIKEPIQIFDFLQKVYLKKKYNKVAFEKFELFRGKYFNETTCLDRNDLDANFLDSYDFVIVGSDQVWTNSEALNDQYFFDYNTKAKKISYAADSADSSFVTEAKEKLQNALQNFHAISVRNKHSFEFVNQIINTEPEIVSDPSLLCDFSTLEIPSSKSDYIFAYILGAEIEGGHDKVIAKIRAKYGNLPVYLAQISNMDFKLTRFSDRTYYDLSPEEWLGYIKEAKFVYTDSFHGVLFSLKYQKHFVSYFKETLRAPRFLDLIERYNLGSFIVNNVKDIDLNVMPDYLSINSTLDCQIEDSIQFLIKSTS